MAGAIDAFRRDVLVALGGVSGDTLAEDTDLALAIGQLGYRVVYAEQAFAWTEAPSTLTGPWRQRYRWSFGTMQAVWKNKGAIVSRDPRQHRAASAAAHDLVPDPAAQRRAFDRPLRALRARLHRPHAGRRLLAGLQRRPAVAAIVAFRVDREPLGPLWALPLQQLVYRQLMYLVIMESTISASVGARGVDAHPPHRRW